MRRERRGEGEDMDAMREGEGTDVGSISVTRRIYDLDSA